MKRAGDLFDRVVAFDNLLSGAKKALRGKRLKSVSAAFYFHLEDELLTLQEELVSRHYVPRPYHVFEIREPKVRKIAAADFRDRVVHHALCNVLESVFERRLIFDSYACRFGKGSHKAIKRLQQFTRKSRYFLKCDIQKYFDSVDHEILKTLLRKMIKDGRVLILLDQIIDHPVPGNCSGKGLPIGNLTSQHFANLYLGELDHYLKERLRVPAYLRYMDDFIILSGDKRTLHVLLNAIRDFLREKLLLNLKEKVLLIAPITEGIPFLGFRVYPQIIRLQRRNLVRWRKKMREGREDYAKGRISEADWIASLRSTIAHISHADSWALRRKELESWLLAQ